MLNKPTGESVLYAVLCIVTLGFIMEPIPPLQGRDIRNWLGIGLSKAIIVHMWIGGSEHSKSRLS